MKKGKLPIVIAICAMSLATASMAQDAMRTISGRVLDDKQQPIPGAAVVVPGTTIGTVTDMDGNYTITLPKDRNTLSFSFLGYGTVTQEAEADGTMDVTLTEEGCDLAEVVAVGYGSVRKVDMTGSVASVSAKDFNQGLINSAEQLINGKVSGVQIMSNSGSPSAGSTIKIRGGASLNASNDPLIVLDGVPLENGGIAGNSNNFLSLINPADIESMTVLKDASSTAIYGSRASNGVILITTKKGSNKGLHVNVGTTHSVQHASRFADMLSRSEFANVATKAGYGNMVGSESTDWNDEIFRTAYGTDNNISLSDNVGGKVPVRLSVGYYHQNGILLTDKAQRVSGNLNVSPTLLDGSLKLSLGLKGSLGKNRFASGSAIWGGATMNPTIPVHATYEGEAQFGGYNEAISYTTNEDGSVTPSPISGAVLNPVGLLKQTKDQSDVKRLVANLDADYTLPMLPELKMHATLGYDKAKGEGDVTTTAESAGGYNGGGSKYSYGPQKNSNKLLTIYANYAKTWHEGRLDATVGYDYQMWKSTTPSYEVKNYAGEVTSTVRPQDQRHAMISYYARANYVTKDRYMATATLRRDGTSRFGADNRWGTFPSAALGWRMSEEEFMQGASEVLSNLKLRASYGVTGQQEGIGNYAYLPLYTESTPSNDYVMGNDVVSTYRPSAYVSDLKWETTKAWNFGLDFALWGGLVSGAMEYYTRKTEDLLATVNVAAGTNFNKSVLSNVGNVDSKGVEMNLTGMVINKEDCHLELTMTAAWQEQTVKNLSLVKNAEITNTLVGPAVDGKQVQVLTEGYSPYMFYVYHQIYDKSGRPIEGAYADCDRDGEINTEDLYRFHSPAPDWILGLSANLQWRSWSLGTSLRSNIGNYVYNGMAMNTGALETMKYNDKQLNNLSVSYKETHFGQRQYYSDYYVENASFLKMDNVTLGYNFGQLGGKVSMNATLMVQNVFTVTKYTGVDPEVPSGVDMNFYPRPQIYSLSIGLEF